MDLDRNPAVVAHGDSGFDLSRAATWFRDGLKRVETLIAEHHGWEAPNWPAVLGADSPLLDLAKAISNHRDSGDLGILFTTLGIEVTSEFWGGDMPGHGGHYLIAWADGRLRQQLRTGLRRLAKALEKWNAKLDRANQIRADNEAHLAALRRRLQRLESRETWIRLKKAGLMREIETATRIKSRNEARDALAESNEEPR